MIDYDLGRKRAYTSMLRVCLRALGVNDPEAEHIRWICERQGAIEQLRDLCTYFGDNDWPDNLDLADIIDKHLARHLWQEAASVVKEAAKSTS